MLGALLRSTFDPGQQFSQKDELRKSESDKRQPHVLTVKEMLIDVAVSAHVCLSSSSMSNLPTK